MEASKMTRRMSEQKKASRKRAKWLAEFRATLTDDELNREALKGMGLSDSDIDAILGESIIVDAEIVDIEDDPSTDQAVNRADEPAIHLPAVIAKPKPTGQQQDSIKYTQWSEEWWQNAKPEVRQRRCKAHKKDGAQCLKAAINGATVCRYHGGAARHVKAAARARIENAADLMAKKLLHMAVDDTVADAVKLSAIKDALDRGGLKAPETVVVSPGQTSSFDQVFDGIYSGPQSTSTIEHVEPNGIGSQRDSIIDVVAEPTDPATHTAPAMTPDADYTGSDGPQSDEPGSPSPTHRPAGQNGAQPVTGYEAIRLGNAMRELARGIED